MAEPSKFTTEEGQAEVLSAEEAIAKIDEELDVLRRLSSPNEEGGGSGQAEGEEELDSANLSSEDAKAVDAHLAEMIERINKAIAGSDFGPQDFGDGTIRTLYVHRPVINGGEILAWAKEQGFTSLLPASKLHVTLAFSRQPVDWMKIDASWSETLELPLGGPRMVEQFGEATVLLFASSELAWRHEEFESIGASWDFPSYRPHITLTYGGAPEDLAKIEPYRGRIVLGPEVFEEVDEDWANKVKEEME